MAGDSVPPSPPDTPGLRANRACRHCVQIKAKCIALEGSDNSICQRRVINAAAIQVRLLIYPLGVTDWADSARLLLLYLASVVETSQRMVHHSWHWL